MNSFDRREAAFLLQRKKELRRKKTSGDQWSEICERTKLLREGGARSIFVLFSDSSLLRHSFVLLGRYDCVGMVFESFWSS